MTSGFVGCGILAFTLVYALVLLIAATVSWYLSRDVATVAGATVSTFIALSIVLAVIFTPDNGD